MFPSYSCLGVCVLCFVDRHYFTNRLPPLLSSSSSFFHQRLNAGLSRNDIQMLVEWIKDNYKGVKADEDEFVISEDELKCVIDIHRLMERSSKISKMRKKGGKAEKKRDHRRNSLLAYGAYRN